MKKETQYSFEEKGLFIVIALVLFYMLFFEKSDDLEKLKNRLGEYDTFYIECVDYFNGKSIVSDSLIGEIEDPDMFDQGEFMGDTSEENVEEVCTYLEKQSKIETVEVIDSSGQSKEDRPEKEWSRF